MPRGKKNKQKENLKITLKGTLVFLTTTLLSFVITFGLGWLLTNINNVAPNIPDFIGLLIIALFGYVAVKVREGVELVTGVLGIKVVLVYAIFLALDNLPFKIPYFSFIIATNIISAAQVVFTYWMAEGLIERAIKK